MNRLVKRLVLPLHAVLAVIALMAIPATSPVSPVEASVMGHAEMADMNPTRNVCCSQTGGLGTMPEALAIDERRESAPDPAPSPVMPFYLQSQTLFVPKTTRQPLVHRVAQLRPPDITTQTAVYHM